MIPTLACGMGWLAYLVVIPFGITILGGLTLALSFTTSQGSPFLFGLGALETLTGLLTRVVSYELFTFTLDIRGPWWSLPLGIATMWVNVRQRTNDDQPHDGGLVRPAR
jgi:hypothetical protein